MKILAQLGLDRTIANVLSQDRSQSIADDRERSINLVGRSVLILVDHPANAAVSWIANQIANGSLQDGNAK